MLLLLMVVMFCIYLVWFPVTLAPKASMRKQGVWVNNLVTEPAMLHIHCCGARDHQNEFCV